MAVVRAERASEKIELHEIEGLGGRWKGLKQSWEGLVES